MATKKCSSVFNADSLWPKETTKQLEAMGFVFEEMVGSGSFATVYKATMINDKKSIQVACKVINLKTKSPRYRDKFFPREIEATRKLKHKYIIHVYQIVNDPSSSFCFIFMQLAKSDLLAEITEKESHQKIDESQGKVWAEQIIEALMYLHANHWVHRDLKVENILISFENTALLSDFGFTRQQRPDALSDTHCGSLAYAAPEVIFPAPGSKSRSYDAYKADTWSIGVVLFVMHTGQMPFDDSDIRKVRKQQQTVKQTIDEQEISSKLKSLIKGLLGIDPHTRMTLKHASEDPWIKDKSRRSVVSSIKSAVNSLIGSRSSMSTSVKTLSASSTASHKSGISGSTGSLNLPLSSPSFGSNTKNGSKGSTGSLRVPGLKSLTKDGSSVRSKTGSRSGSSSGSGSSIRSASASNSSSIGSRTGSSTKTSSGSSSASGKS